MACKGSEEPLISANDKGLEIKSGLQYSKTPKVEPSSCLIGTTSLHEYQLLQSLKEVYRYIDTEKTLCSIILK